MSAIAHLFVTSEEYVMKCRRIGRVRAVKIAAKMLPLIGLLPAAGSPAMAQAQEAKAWPGDNGGVTLPPGFCANGVVYVNTWSGRYYGNDTPPAGGFLVALQDTKGDGKADVIKRFGDSTATGGHGGTGIALYNGGLYAEVNDRIVRYALPAGVIAPTAAPQVVVSGLPLSGDHPMHPFVIDGHGDLY